MLKVHADKTFSASPPDLQKPLESEGLLLVSILSCNFQGFVIIDCYMFNSENVLVTF
jgi:hypothetical protein